MRRVSSFIMILLLAGQVWADPHTLDFAGSTFQPESYEIDGQTYYQTDDQEILQLLSRANISAQWSSSGHTLFAFAPGRESYWSVDSNTIKVNNQEVKAPGKLILRDGVRYIEPAALFFAMATRGAKTETGYELYPVITQVAQGDTGYLLRSASKARPKVVESGDVTVLSIPNFAWDGQDNVVVMGDTRFEFQGGADQGQPLSVTITPPTFYEADYGGSTLLNETKIDLLPSFPGAEYSSDVTLTSMTAQETDGLPMLVWEFDQGAKAHYLKDEKTGDITVYIPKADFAAESFRSSDWPGVEVASYNTALYPVLEITIPSDNSAYEFVQIENAATTLALIKGSKGEVKDLALSGSVQTPGWMNIRGTIVIDPGHGGSDPGCVNRALGTREADITLRICKHLASILRQQGWKVVMTRTTDRDVTYAGSPDRMELESRANIANEMGADLFMSVHCNASVNTGATGSSIHWWKAEDYAFAQAIEPVLGHAIGLDQDGLIRNRFVVLRHSQMPSVLVETAFLTNAREGAKLSDPEFQKVIARQLAGGLANYMRGAYASRGRRAVD